MSMTVNNSLYSNYADTGMKKSEAPAKTRAEETKTKNETGQPQLSKAAQKLLEKLRNTYSDMDFMVADFQNAEEAKAAIARGTKEVSVLFSSEELEKMASDEKCEKEYMDRVKGALRMSDEINRQFGFESAFGKNSGTEITKIGISFNADGTSSLFAELEKSSANQKEHIQKMQEEKRAEKKEDAKKQKERLEGSVKRTIVQADSMEELLKKIRETDWSKIRPENEIQAGGKFDFSI